MSHTILLVQLGTDKGTRTYNDYVSVSKCMEGMFVRAGRCVLRKLFAQQRGVV